MKECYFEGVSHNAQITKSAGIVDNFQGSHCPAVMQYPLWSQTLKLSQFEFLVKSIIKSN